MYSATPSTATAPLSSSVPPTVATGSIGARVWVIESSDSGAPPKGAWEWTHSNTTIAAGSATSRRRSGGVASPTHAVSGPHPMSAVAT